MSIPGIRHRMTEFLPPWLLRYHAFRYLYAHALIADAAIEAAAQAVLARFPGIGTPTALPRIARDRKIRRGYAETDEAFSDRSLTWRDDHKTKGNPYTLMRQVRGYLSPLRPRMRVVNSNGDWFTLNTDGTTARHTTYPSPNWDWDGNAALGRRVWLIIYSTGAEAPWTRDGTWGDGETWGDPPDSTWGSTATPAQVRAIRDIVREFRSAVARYESIVIAFDDDVFSPTGTVPPNPDGSWELFQNRSADAIFWDGAS
jgi:hypothetical protein